MALQCAIKLGIPNAINRHGGVASLSELHACVPVTASKRPCLSRILTFLAATGISREEEFPEDALTAAGPRYHLTVASRLLVDDDDAKGDGRGCVAQLFILCSSSSNFTVSQLTRT